MQFIHVGGLGAVSILVEEKLMKSLPKDYTKCRMSLEARSEYSIPLESPLEGEGSTGMEALWNMTL